MVFIDEVNITVIAGNGGNGYIGFRNNKKRRYLNSSNSSNGGDGGDVWLSVDNNLSTLNYFQFHRIFQAEHGQRGGRQGCTGKKGQDLIIKVPWGTRVRDVRTNELLGDMGINQHSLRIAKGGLHGIGNICCNSKLNCQSPYDRIGGKKGECRNLLLELLLIADVGVFGLPNSGKSSFIRVISSAKPKISDYPFTTLVPYLGMVKIADDKKFVVADVPGIIKGASLGSGLGIRFLKHLERCNMLLHFVDIAPLDNSDPVKNVITVFNELKNYNYQFIYKPCWLIFNKIDLLGTMYEVEKKVKRVVEELQWTENYYFISAMYNINVSFLCKKIMKFIIDLKK